jgi:uncharacterized protein (TIGR02266 family)
VESPDVLPAGEAAKVTLSMPEGGAFVVLATVRHAVTPTEAAFFDGVPGMRLEFLLLEGEVLERWGAFLEQVAKGALPLTPVAAPPPSTEKREPPPDVQLKEGRRSAPRRDARFRVRLRDEGALNEFYTRNISRGGMFLVTNKLLPTGSKLELLVVHPVTGREFALEARVRWTANEGGDDDHGMGVALVPRTLDQEEEFIDFMHQG